MTAPTPVSRFNAWHDPWIPVTQGRLKMRLSLRQLMLDAHQLQGLGTELTPLDRESMYRFLVCIAAMIGRRATNWTGPNALPMDAVDSFGADYQHRFALFGEQPFLQRWDRNQQDLDALVAAAAGRPVKALHPIEQLHPSEPGASSSQWAVRRDPRDPADPAVATLLLVTAWFQTKNGNGLDPWGGRATKGSAGTWHTNPLSVWYVDPIRLSRTIWANVPAVWLDRSDIPLFLDHHSTGLPQDFGTAVKASVTRFSYAQTLPLLHLRGDTITGFVLGADATIPVPPLGKDAKVSLGLVHEHDHTRLYTEKVDAKGVVTAVKARGGFKTKLSTTEGFMQWFKADRGVARSLRTWRTLPRVLHPSDADRDRWSLEMLSETTDGKGSREWATWDSMPDRFAGAEGEELERIQRLLEFASRCRSAFLPAGRTATGESKASPAILTGQAAFYRAIHPVLTRLEADVAAGEMAPDHIYVDHLTRLAIKVFAVTTDPFLTPSRVAAVAKSRADLQRLLKDALKKAYPNQHNHESEDVA